MIARAAVVAATRLNGPLPARVPSCSAMETWTVRRVLGWTAERFGRERYESPRLDAEILLAYVLSAKRIELYMDHDRALAGGELERFRELVKRRLDGEPVAYLVGRREFWSLDLKIDPRVLVPRPESEALVEEALARLAGRVRPRLLDVGTGSGALALALANERPDAEVWATDLSPGAVELAGENAERLGLAVRVVLGDLLAGAAGERFDLVIANLPYLRPDEVRPSLRHEPRMALTAEDDGFALTRRLIDEAPDALAPGGVLAVEVASGRADEILAMFGARGAYDQPRVRNDLSGIERVVSAALA